MLIECFGNHAKLQAFANAVQNRSSITRKRSVAGGM